MRRLYMLQIGIVLLTSVVLAQKDIKPPETFTASAQVLGNNIGSSARVTMQIDRRPREGPHDDPGSVEGRRLSGLTYHELASAPEIGFVEMNGRKVTARWAASADDREGSNDLDRHRCPDVLRRRGQRGRQTARRLRRGNHSTQRRFNRARYRVLRAGCASQARRPDRCGGRRLRGDAGQARHRAEVIRQVSRDSRSRPRTPREDLGYIQSPRSLDASSQAARLAQAADLLAPLARHHRRRSCSWRGASGASC